MTDRYIPSSLGERMSQQADRQKKLREMMRKKKLQKEEEEQRKREEEAERLMRGDNE